MSDKNFDPGMKDTCELKEAWADGKKLYYVEDIPGLLEQIASSNKQLAKANERVAELEAQQQLLVNEIEPLLDLQEDGEYYERTHIAEKIYSDFVEQSLDVALNKFAIEQKINGLKDYQALCGFADCRKSIDARIEQLEEQLRKEQEK